MRSKNPYFWTTRMPVVLLVCAVTVITIALTFYACTDNQSPTGPLTAEQAAAAVQAATLDQDQYVQELAEEFAPFLWFDRVVPRPDMDSENWYDQWGFPMDPQLYYDLRNAGYRHVINNYTWESLVTGWVPTFYSYGVCSKDFVIRPQTLNWNEDCIPLLTEKKIEVGTVCWEYIETDDGAHMMEATFLPTSGWELSDVRFWFGSSLSDMPRTTEGNPAVGDFPYLAEVQAGQTSCSLQVPLVTCGETILAAANAEVRRSRSTAMCDWESAWAAGNPMTGEGNWATYFSAEQICDVEEIMYWWFYGWQSPCCNYDGEYHGFHHGDWERVAVKIVDGELERVMYFQHDSWYTKGPTGFVVRPDDGSCYEWGHSNCPGGKPGTHPTVFVGRLGHGSYPDNVGQGPPDEDPAGWGICWECCPWADWRDPAAVNGYKHLHSENNLVRLRRPAPPGGPYEWMNYQGSWKAEEWGTGGECGPFRNVPQECHMPGCKGNDPECNFLGDNQQGCTRSEVLDDEIF